MLTALEAGYEDARRQVFLRTRDLSESGAFLCTDDPPAIGAQAQIRLELPGCAAILRLRGTVIRREPGDAGEPPGFALHFDHEANEPALRELQAYVERVVRGPAETVD